MVKKLILLIMLAILFLNLVSADFQENISLDEGWNEFSPIILPSNNTLENTLLSISGDYSQVKTVIDGTSLFWDESFPDWAITLNHINFSQTYAIKSKENVILQLVGFPDPSKIYWINSSWSSWYELNSCNASNLKDLQKNITQYDYNNINQTNVTYYDYNSSIPCDYCQYNVVNTSWTQWQDIDSCSPEGQINQTRSKIEYDSNYNSCYALTNLTEDLWNNGNNNTYLENRTTSCEYKVEIEVCDEGCDYPRVRDAIDDLYCFDHIEREFNFTNCSQLEAPLRIFVHNGNRSRVELVNLSNIEIIGESKEGVVINGDNIYSNFIIKYSDNITIANYSWNNGWQGIWMMESNNNKFININSTNDYNYAIFITNHSSNNLVSKVSCDTIANQSCFRSHLWSHNNTWEYLEAKNAWYNGIVIAYHVTNNTVRHSNLHNNGYDGIFVGTNATNNYFYNNTAHSNGAAGLRFYYESNNNTVEDLEVWNTTDDGLIIKNNSRFNLIKNSYFHNNHDNGVFIWRSNNNTFDNITSQFNHWHCVSNAEANGTVVINSLLTNTWNRSGVYTEAGHNLYIANNTIMHNDVGVFNLNASYALIENNYFENNSEGVYINSKSRNVTTKNNDFYLNHVGIWISVLINGPEDDNIRINNTYLNKGCDVDYSTLGCQFDYTNPGPITDLQVSPESSNKYVYLNWTATCDNYIPGWPQYSGGGVEGCYGYDWGDANEDYILKYYFEPITTDNWNNASTFGQGWNPINSGNEEEKSIQMPAYGYYWFAIRPIDDNGREGPISNSVQGLSPKWEVGIYRAECRNKRTMWGCSESDGVSSPTTNYWFDTFTYNLTVLNTGNMPQTRPTYAHVKDDWWTGEPDYEEEFNYNFTIDPWTGDLPITTYTIVETQTQTEPQNQTMVCFNISGINPQFFPRPECLEPTIPGQPDCIDEFRISQSCRDYFDITTLGNIDVILNYTEEGYHQSIASIKDISPDACGPFSPGMQCGRSQAPYSGRNHRSFSMAKHLTLVIDPEHWGDSVVPIEEGNNTANKPFWMDVFFRNNNTQIYYNHVPYNFTINTTYPWESNDTKCGSARGYTVTDDNPLQNATGWYHLPSNTYEYTQYCSWHIMGLPPGIYEFSYSSGYYEEDKPATASIVGRFV